VIAQIINFMNFLKGPKQFTPLLHTLIAVTDKGFIAVTGFVIAIYQCIPPSIRLLPGTFLNLIQDG
jgi:hypothetical protein